jgi:hypothetical protein
MHIASTLHTMHSDTLKSQIAFHAKQKNKQIGKQLLRKTVEEFKLPKDE